MFFDGVLHTFPIPGLLLASIWAWPKLTLAELSQKTVPDDSCELWLFAYRSSVLRNPLLRRLRRLRFGPELGARYGFTNGVGGKVGCWFIVVMKNWGLYILWKFNGEIQTNQTYIYTVLVFHPRVYYVQFTHNILCGKDSDPIFIEIS